jgi:hypothetical protein
MSNTNRVQLALIEESTWGTTPSTPNMDKLRITSESLGHEVETITSAELRADRNLGDVIQVNRQNTGGFEFELSYGTFDDLIAAALFSDWNANVVKNGVTRRSFSMEKALTDIDEYFIYRGMVVSEFTLNLATRAICTGSFNFMGGASVLQQTAFATTYTAAPTTDVMNCMTNVASIQEGIPFTTLSGVFIQNLSFTVANNLRGVSAIGYSTAQDIAYGKCDITGNLSLYFTDDRLYDKFMANTATALFFKMQDVAGNYYLFEFPKVKFASESIPTPGQDQDVIENLTWRALYDSGIGAQVRITRHGA